MLFLQKIEQCLQAAASETAGDWVMFGTSQSWEVQCQVLPCVRAGLSCKSSGTASWAFTGQIPRGRFLTLAYSHIVPVAVG